jgi:fructoselysine 6-kinase
MRCIIRDMGRPPLRVVSVGECTTDHYLDLKKQFVGGISLNFAVNCRRSGAESVSLVSRIGNDHSTVILQKLEHEGIDVTHVSIKTGETARQNIVLTASGERIFPPGGYQIGVLDGYHLNEADLRFVQQHNVLTSALFQQVEPLFRQVMESLLFEGWRIADFLDLSDYSKDIGVIERLHERLKIAFISGGQELMERLRPLSRVTQCLIVITLGAEGSIALVKGEPLYQPPLKVTNVVDSTGCGDAFQAGFTVSYWREDDVRRALQFGARQAARVLQHYGAID